MRKIKIIFITLLSLTYLSPVFAGYGSYDESSHQLKYDVKGEIEVKPDKVIFPIVITLKDKTYNSSLLQAKKVITELETALKNHDSQVFSFSSLDFYKPANRSGKSIDLSFFGRNDELSTTKLVSYLSINFSSSHAFWDRSKYVADALDLMRVYSKKYKEGENKSVYLEDAYYEINNIEQYRGTIVESIYSKARLMADIIAKQENLKPKIKFVSFNQNIQKDVINFSKASLTISAVIEYSFE